MGKRKYQVAATRRKILRLYNPEPNHKTIPHISIISGRSQKIWHRLYVASVIRGFKIGVTKYARQHGLQFAWQPRFYDHVIRNHHEINRIAEYIENNVARWDLDELNTE